MQNFVSQKHHVYLVDDEGTALQTMFRVSEHASIEKYWWYPQNPAPMVQSHLYVPLFLKIQNERNHPVKLS